MSHDTAGAFMALCVWIEIGSAWATASARGRKHPYCGLLGGHNGGTVRCRPKAERLPANRRGEENNGELIVGKRAVSVFSSNEPLLRVALSQTPIKSPALKSSTRRVRLAGVPQAER